MREACEMGEVWVLFRAQPKEGGHYKRKDCGGAHMHRISHCRKKKGRNVLMLMVCLVPRVRFPVFAWLSKERLCHAQGPDFVLLHTL